MWRQFLSSTVLPVANCHLERLAANAFRSRTELRRWNSSIKMTKQLKRMFDRGSGSKRKKIFPGPVNIGITSSEGVEVKPRRKPVYTEGQRRRAHQVGRVLYDNIVHLVNSGQLSERLAALSVDLVRVKVVPDFSVANVYWLSSGTKEDATVQTLLNENAGQLRHLLTSLHVLGTIPRICFVRDDSQARYLEVESLLRLADFGPDFVPTRLDSAIRSVVTVGGAEVGDSSPEDRLQAQFNLLNVEAARDSVGAAQKGGESVESGFRRGSELKDEEELDGGGVGKLHTWYENSDGASVSVESETSYREVGQHGLASTSPRQPSSLEVEQLGHQYLPTTDHHSATKPHEPSPSSPLLLDETAASLGAAFRDDVYKVPHSDLLNKILIKKQKAGLRPSVPADADTRETVKTTVEASNLKSLLKRKAKPKGRLKSQSDYYGGEDLVQYREDGYADDFDASDEEVEHDEHSADDDWSRTR
ncbi:uncharacterized protein LOC143285692 [Babylonia areolata]|uniref:uncharacterized protein LOC143285692 n=1 Tax=Babylonia areolata TaxID=304850 RepID=UPI003FD5F67C